MTQGPGRFNPDIFPGAVFGMLTVIKRIPKNETTRSRVLCRCSCGNKTKLAGYDLVTGRTKSCGCQKHSGIRIYVNKKTGTGKYGTVKPGAVFARWTVVKRIWNGDHPTAFAKCKCICGAVRRVSLDGLVTGGSKSCGCLKRDLTVKRNKEASKYGCFSSKYPRTWRVWSSMRSRCCNKKQKAYVHYGACGVVVCAFLKQHPENLKKTIGLAKKSTPSLDRHPIHNGNYTCGQCDECKSNGWQLNIRWATRKTQSENRGDFNVWIEAFGQKLLKSQWMAKSGLSWTCITRRLRRGWAPEKTLSTPDGKGNCYTPA